MVTTSSSSSVSSSTTSIPPASVTLQNMVPVTLTMTIMVITLFTTFVIFAGSRVACQPLNSREEISHFLIKFGYIPKLETESNSNLSPLKSRSSFVDAIKLMQKYAGIAQTGSIDSKTLSFLRRPRCGLPDFVNDANNDINVEEKQLQKSNKEQINGQSDWKVRVKRYSLQGGKWPRTNLTWSIKHWPKNIDPIILREELARALKVWSDVSKLTFTETRSADADIVVSFRSGKHGDDYAFDGPGNILAHAFFPMKGSPIGGDAHFDADEKWVKNSQLTEGNVIYDNDPNSADGVSLFAVAAHEFGHSLGLSHSSVAGSLMFPYYQTMKDDFKLPYDDTVGIQQLYGSKDENKWPTLSPPSSTSKPNVSSTKGTNKPPTSPVYPTQSTGNAINDSSDTGIPETCKTSFDAISSIRREVFIFKGEYFWRLNDSKRLESPTPIETYRFWFNLPKNFGRIDAVYERPKDKNIVFFIGKRYWLYSGNYPLTGYPKPLHHLGLPYDLEKIDAAMVWGHTGRTYLFSGQNYWLLDEKNERVEPDYPRDISVWRGVPYNLDAAFQWHRNGITYFFKGNSFWRFDNRKMKITKDSPQNINEFWFNSICKKPKGIFSFFTRDTSDDDYDDNFSSSLHQFNWFTPSHLALIYIFNNFVVKQLLFS